MQKKEQKRSKNYRFGFGRTKNYRTGFGRTKIFLMGRVLVGTKNFLMGRVLVGRNLNRTGRDESIFEGTGRDEKGIPFDFPEPSAGRSPEDNLLP